MVAFKDTKKVVFKDVNKRYIFTDPAVPSVKDGVDGRDGKDGMVGPQGPAGRDGRDGSGINWLGEYNPGAQYQPNDSVFYLGSSYICIKPTRDNPPNQSKTYWNLLASAGAGGANGRNAGATDIPLEQQTLLGSLGQKIVLTVRDDLSSMAQFRCSLQGYLREQI